jgi:hypothetical protein
VPKASAATYDADNRLVTFNGIAVTFDANGNMLSMSPGTAAKAGFRYDVRNQLREGDGVSYTYGVLGSRIGIKNQENHIGRCVWQPPADWCAVPEITGLPCSFGCNREWR